MNGPFWIVWNPNGGNPTYRHASRSGARSEAARLAVLHPDQYFYVLEADGRCIARSPVTWDDLGCPF